MSILKITDLHRIFQRLDKDNNGFVSLEELNWLLGQIGVVLSLEELESLVGNTQLNFKEFLSFYDSISKKTEVEGQESTKGDDEDDLIKAFKVFDLNGDGVITCEELQCVLSRLGLWDENSGNDCNGMINVYDTNMDGVLDFEEFKNMMFLDSIS